MSIAQILRSLVKRRAEPTMLKFTQNQLEFLLFVQSQDDWHCEAFVKVVQSQRNENFMPDKKLDEAEFEEMMEKLEAFSKEKICNLQTALNYLQSL
ncbi:hypothetical protein [aff. Roholtiella sp. LEGE 12411]|uniref:hypothetical protein n=1 Tax=aff. Roholtiella sp. LEGE 12411 TaxID=1828822 RepID=UPI001882C85E|nr:hypothetical protein [aff. Roholtiella sp. LEGE 12411]MBE9038858.1 hypothetical protein [aff. Roholtiella sp. LEGE 12411]